ncbi:response regulator transcription factor [Pedobacter frigiditerrae]|uniref:Response regulator transcription factor n=1 Tax=Pedobacter frigiditerrae TaxID=2530452 RepID=A0A4V2MIX1_9SPHI|nr:LytTR family DNA-binding domain-containing protein [Pedobacter frigiditerrae]TCC91696.1 response regulator transcription factor [Pedobacter frigiditerrae]
MYKCIIIDDEPHAIEGLTKYIDSLSELVLTKSYIDPLLALKDFDRIESVDIIFLDIDMPKINGIELSKEIRNKTKKLVFTTAHTKYAYEAFEANADAFLLKPYSLGKFIITINKLFPEKAIDEKVEENTGIKKDFFFVKSKEDDLKILKIRYADIVAIESKQNYVMIYTLTKKVLTYMSLTEIAKILNTMPGFMQLHRSFIISLDQIETIDGSLVKMTNGIRISVGDNYRKEFNAFVADKLIKTGKQT